MYYFILNIFSVIEIAAKCCHSNTHKQK